MALLRYDNVRVAGMAAAVPRHVEHTVSTTAKYDDESYIASVGVRQKRFSNDFTAGDLGEAAAKRLLSDLGWGSDVDLLLMVTQTPDYILPATSCVLHGRLGLKRSCAALDINLGCSGWVYGMAVAMSMMQTGSVRRAIVIAGDARKQVPEEHDQLFGFATTATAIEYKQLTNVNGGATYIDLGSDGTGFDAIIRPYGGARNPITIDALTPRLCEDGRMRHGCQTVMKGMDVFAFGITTAPKSIRNILKESQQTLDDVDYVVFHQANVKMLETIRKKLKLAEDKVPYSLKMFGNTSSASIPLTVVTMLKEALRGRVASRLIGCGFGVGLSWGTILFSVDEHFVVSDLQELGDE